MSFRPIRTPSSLGLFLLTLILIAVAFTTAWRPMQSVHWDAPIYLYQAKRFADTPLVASYISHAAAIASQIQSGQLTEGEGYSESYWRFTRLGHIALLGGIIKIFGSNETGILAASLVYALILGMGVLWAVIGGRALCRLYQPEGPLGKNLPQFVLLAGFIYVFSGSYIYMAGNLVAEVPALLGVSLGFWLLVQAIQSNNRFMAVASGLLAYLTFAVMMEAVWFFVSLYLALWLAPPAEKGRGPVTILLFWAALFAIIGYALHVWLFGSLATPKTAIGFQQQVAAALPGSNTDRMTPFVATGLLWMGIPLAILAGWRTPLTRFAWIWLFLCLLPLLFKYFGGQVQTRMFVLLILPLMLLVALGFTTLTRIHLVTKNRRLFQAGLVAIVLGSFSIAHPTIYAQLRQLPGAWRLQYVRMFLWPPAYEVVFFPLKDLRQIADWLHIQNKPLYLLAAPGIKQENLNIIRFLGPAYPPSADLATQPDPTNLLPCGADYSSPYEPVVYRGGSPTVCCSAHHMNQVFMLSSATPATSYSAPTPLKTALFTVSQACATNQPPTH